MLSIEMPRCCNKIMNVEMETMTYIEASCDICGDKVYIKKTEIFRPQLLDD